MCAATDDVDREAFTEAMELVREATDVGRELSAEVLPSDELTALDDAPDGTDKDTDALEAEDGGAEDSKLLLGAAEDATELTEGNTDVTLAIELGRLDAALLKRELETGATDGAAPTKVASWTRPYATRRPGESFMVSS